MTHSQTFEAPFHDTFLQAPVGLAHIDLAGRWLAVNPAVSRILDHGAEDLLARTFADVVHPDDSPPDWCQVAGVLEAGAPSHAFEQRCIRRDGTWRWLHVTVALVRSRPAEEGHFLAVLDDVTPRVEAREHLEQTNERYRALLDSAHEGFCIIDVLFEGERPVDYRFVQLNTSFMQQTGLADAIGRTARELVPDLDPFWFATYGRVATSGQRARFERHEPAMARWFDVEAWRVGPSERPCVAILFRDVTARKRMEADLRDREARLRAVFDSLVEGVVFLDPTGAVVEANDAVSRIHGHLDGDLMDADRDPRHHILRPDGTPFPVEDQPALVALRSGQAVRDVEMGVPAADGRLRWRLVNAQPVRNPDGELAGVVASFFDITDRRKAEEALRVSEGRLRRVFEMDVLGIIEWDLTGSVHGANDEFLRIVGYTRAELSAGAIDWIRMTPPEHAAQDTRAVEELRRTGKHAPLEKEYVRRDGSRIWVLVGSVLLDAKGGVGFVLDISRQRAGEQALRESDDRARVAAARAERERAVLDAILEAAPAGIIVAGPEGRILRTNPANELLWGPTPASGSVDEYEEWRGWWADQSARHGERVKPHEWAMARALAGHTVRDDIVEIEPFGRPGHRRTMVNSGAPVRDAEGRITGAVVVQMNISALVAAEAARRESEARVRVLADHIDQLAWMAEPDGSISWFNQRWVAYTGLGIDQKRRAGDLVAPEDRGRVRTSFRTHIEAGEPWEETFRLRRHDGEYRWFLSRAVPVRDEQGVVIQWFGTNTDITRQREVEEALREADRRKDDFIAVLAHELRNPLAPVSTSVELLRRLSPDDPRLARARDIIDRQVAHMVRLIEDLLDVSRIKRGRLPLHVQTCDLRAIARQTAEDYRASLEAHGVRLMLAEPGAPIWVEGDPVRLAQMIGNLLNNAGRFTDTGGVVELRVETDDAGARAVVTDTGAGIEPAMLTRLFDPFSQAEQGLARSKGGLGLGLALTRGLAELHGGTVEASSAGPGQGATFTIRLPLSPHRATRLQVDDAPGTPEGRLRVLVIEDNPDAAETLGALIELWGHEVRMAADGLAGCTLGAQFLPDVVICDIGLPGELDGYGVARRLRAERPRDRPYLLALSGYASDDDRRRSAEAGFDEHMAKPGDVPRLRRLLDERLDRAAHRID